MSIKKPRLNNEKEKENEKLIPSDSAIANKMLHHLPVDLLRYQLMPNLDRNTSVQLTQTSHSFFDTLCHHIRRTEFVSCERFIQQSNAHSPHTGICSAVRVSSKDELAHLMNHVVHNAGNKHPLLHLEIEFNELLGDIVLPATLRTLQFASSFNKSIHNIILPASLHTLALGNEFDQSLDKVRLPGCLHTLTFWHCFNQAIDHVLLPANMQTLTFGEYFNKPLSVVNLP